MAVVVVQLGHCYRRSGATGTAGEQEFATAAGNACRLRLAQAGHTPKIILADDPLDAYRGDAFVAIHCDGSTSASAHGASVGYRNTPGRELAAGWKRHYAAAGWVGFRPDNYTAALAGYYGVRRAVSVGNTRAFIAEAGFLTNPGDRAKLTAVDGPDRFARALTAVVVDTFGGRPQEDPVTETEMNKIASKVVARIEAELDEPRSVFRQKLRELAKLGADDALDARDTPPAG